MRVLVFAMLAHLEATMLEAIERSFTSPDEALSRLGSSGEGQVRGLARRLREKQLNPSLLELTTLEQKGVILTAAGVFSGSQNEVRAEFADIYERLRNPLMHAAGIVDDSLAALRELDMRLDRVRERTGEAASARAARDHPA